jgi:CHASE3 domain sensor protein
MTPDREEQQEDKENYDSLKEVYEEAENTIDELRSEISDLLLTNQTLRDALKKIHEITYSNI